MMHRRHFLHGSAIGALALVLSSWHTGTSAQAGTEDECYEEKERRVAGCYKTYDECLQSGAPQVVCDAELSDCLSAANELYRDCLEFCTA